MKTLFASVVAATLLIGMAWAMAPVNIGEGACTAQLMEAPYMYNGLVVFPAP
ncbi:MAG: hypothetical protein AB1646_04180 [Thermodesulfobacteriota bacterium]